ncbi:5182_t:CDS:2 [Ambispora gerdemannii]|uniref:5182_t:CDS:1 n=1 Tax=Ambispora gerdemannii TaxID=144530 RepID=A0A9N9ADB7_9GLOM|nr:5182_t:CDS:2 [Ambispora gerdemannii]
MNRSFSLTDDLRTILNNPSYGDFVIKCSDSDEEGGEVLHCTRAILAARSEFFDSLFQVGMLEEINSEISFPEIATTTMKLVLEFIYAGDFKDNRLLMENLVDVFHAANYLQLPALELITSSIVENLNPEEDFGLLIDIFEAVTSKFSHLDENDISIYRIICDKIAEIPFEWIPYDKMTDKMLNVILLKLQNKQKNYLNSEYSILRYIILWGAKKISARIFTSYEKFLPSHEAVEKNKNKPHELKIDPDIPRRLSEQIDQFLPLVDLELIPHESLNSFIQPLNLISQKQLTEAYQFHLISDLQNTDNFEWDKKTSGRNLIFYHRQTIVKAPINLLECEIARSSKIFFDDRTYFWTIWILRVGEYTSIGIGQFGEDSNEWLMDMDGYYLEEDAIKQSEVSFKNGDRVEVRLNMKDHTCGFSINGGDVKIVFHRLPEVLYPALPPAMPETSSSVTPAPLILAVEWEIKSNKSSYNYFS